MQSFIGLTVGAAGSFSVLHHVTDRRLLARPRVSEADKDPFRYEVLLYRRMWESSEASASRQFETKKLIQLAWNDYVVKKAGELVILGGKLSEWENKGRTALWYKYVKGDNHPWELFSTAKAFPLSGDFDLAESEKFWDYISAGISADTGTSGRASRAEKTE